MATYLLSYDIVRSPAEYPELWKALERDGAVRILLSEWLIQTNETSGTLADRYMKHIDQNDRLFICSADKWAYWKIMNEIAAKQLLTP